MSANVNVKLEMPEQINAKKLANKKVCGIEVLNASQKKQVYKGAEGIKEAQGKVKNAQGDVDDAAYQVNDAENEEDECEATEKDGKSKKDAAPSDADLSNSQADLAASSEVALAHTEELETVAGEMDEMSASVMEETQAQYDIIEDANENLDTISGEIDELMAELETESSKGGNDVPPEKGAPATDNNSDGMGGVVDANFDGTGSGQNSAYSLTLPTGDNGNGEKGGKGGNGNRGGNGGKGGSNPPAYNPAPTPNPTPSSSSNPSPSTSTGNNGGSNYQDIINQVNQRAAMAAQYEASVAQANDTVTTTNDASTDYYNGVTDDANAVNEEAETQLVKNAELKEGAQTAQEIGKLTSYAGKATEAVGVGLNVTGNLMSTAGVSTASTGMVLNGIGAGLISLGGPLCAVFGIGTPIVGSGTGTTFAGTSVTGVGTVLEGKGQILSAAGVTTRGVGKGLQAAGSLTQAGASGVLTYCAIDEGDWRGALTNGLSTVASAVSAVGFGAEAAGNIAEAAGKAGETAAKVAEAAKTVSEYTSMASNVNNIAWGTVDTVKAIENGDTIGAITSAFDVAGNAVQLAGGINNQINGGVNADGETNTFGKVVKNIDKGLKVGSGAFNTAVAIEEGNVEGAIINAAGTVASGLSFGKDGSNLQSAGKIVSGLSGVYTNGKAAYEGFEQGDLSGIVNGIESTMGAVGSAASVVDGVKNIDQNVKDNKLQKRVDEETKDQVEAIQNNKELSDEDKEKQIKEVKDNKKAEIQLQNQVDKETKKDVEKIQNDKSLSDEEKEAKIKELKDNKKSEIEKRKEEQAKYDEKLNKKLKGANEALEELNNAQKELNAIIDERIAEVENDPELSQEDKAEIINNIRRDTTIAYEVKIDGKVVDVVQANNAYFKDRTTKWTNARQDVIDNHNESTLKKIDKYTKATADATKNVLTVKSDWDTMSINPEVKKAKEEAEKENQNNRQNGTQSTKSYAELQAILNRFRIY